MGFSYSVVLSDPDNLETANDPTLVTDLQAALADWSQYIAGLGTLVVNLVIASTSVGRADGGPTAVVPVGTAADGAQIEEPSSVYELITGQHVLGASSDITVTVDPTYISTLFLNPDPGNGAAVPNDEIDAVSVFRHELAHGFGISGYYDQNGNLFYNGLYESTFDTHIQKNADGTAAFVGPISTAVYGGPVPLTTDSTTQNYYHFANSVSEPLGQDLMNGQYFYYGATYRISDVDLAVLADIGVPVTGLVDGPLPCFRAGTLIRTPEGDRPVEALRPGDAVLVLGEARQRPVRWVGRRRVDCRRHPEPRAVWPVRVAADAFGPGAPATDLWLSPYHAVFAEGVLIPIRHLLNGGTIRQVPLDAVTYCHVELDAHDVLLAEGLPAESFLPGGDRSGFEAGGGAVRLHPDFHPLAWEAEACAPLVVSGPVLDRVRALLAATGRPDPVAA
jgi:hypothetical protein